jgi:transient receptor potential cation channel subfamily V member 5
MTDEDKEEMKEIMEMKRIHERLRNKRKVERERRLKEAQAARDKILNNV